MRQVVKCADDLHLGRGLWFRARAAPLTAGKGDPAGVFGGLPAPVWSHQESTGDREGDDTHDDEEECGDPLGGQPRGNTGPVSSMDGLTLPNQPDCEGACGEKTPLASSFTIKESRVSSRLVQPRSNNASKLKGWCSFSRFSRGISSWVSKTRQLSADHKLKKGEGCTHQGGAEKTQSRFQCQQLHRCHVTALIHPHCHSLTTPGSATLLKWAASEQ